MTFSKRAAFIIGLSVCVLWGTGDAKLVFPGKCPHLPVVPRFNASAYMGLWYESAKYPAPFESGGKCITAQYELNGNGSIEVVNSQYNVYTNKTIQIQGSAVATGNAKLSVSFAGPPDPKQSNYWVLDTDYANYSVVFSCSQISTYSHSRIVWILSRNRAPTLDTFLTALRVISRNGLSLDYLVVTDQDGCPGNML